MKQMWANIGAIIIAKIRFMVAQSLLKNDETFASEEPWSTCAAGFAIRASQPSPYAVLPCCPREVWERVGAAPSRVPHVISEFTVESRFD